jgi:hypothetical protein
MDKSGMLTLVAKVSDFDCGDGFFFPPSGSPLPRTCSKATLHCPTRPVASVNFLDATSQLIQVLIR